MEKNHNETNCVKQLRFLFFFQNFYFALNNSKHNVDVLKFKYSVSS